MNSGSSQTDRTHNFRKTPIMAQRSNSKKATKSKPVKKAAAKSAARKKPVNTKPRRATRNGTVKKVGKATKTIKKVTAVKKQAARAVSAIKAKVAAKKKVVERTVASSKKRAGKKESAVRKVVVKVLASAIGGVREVRAVVGHAILGEEPAAQPEDGKQKTSPKK
ncbi:MAG: hypothetical protein ABI599_11495 [Flavobacteriales bacterium]